MKRHVITLTPAPRGRAEMTLDGKNIGVSAQPIYAAARWLLAQGLAHPDDEIGTVRDGTPGLVGNVGTLAKLAATERDKRGLQVVPFKASPSVPGGLADGREQSESTTPPTLAEKGVLSGIAGGGKS